MRSGPPEIEDPQQRAQVAASERAARDTARAPYRAPNLVPMTISRLATRGDSQVEEVLELLRRSGFAARPDLVFGVYRVPDRISPTLSTSSERGRLVEWDVVHVPASLPPAPAHASAVFFPSRQRWVARRVGESTLLDEDLGRAYMHYAGLGPQHCLGMARMLHLRSDGREESTGIETWVEGLHVLHVPGPRPDTLETMAGAAPMVLDLGHLPPTYTEVLDWAEIARIVQPAPQRPPRVPNPIPSLPSTPQELLRAYLEVVGVMPTDCWSAQATLTDNRELYSQSGMITHNLGPKLPCADGKERSRLHGTQHVVIVYLDRSEYVEGRARWAAYQRDVLQARLTDASDRRAPVSRLDSDSPAVRAVLAPFRALEWLDDLGTTKPPPFYRYCWPPVDA